MIPLKAYRALRAEGEQQAAERDKRYSRTSMKIGAFAAALSGVSSTLFVEALCTQADVDTDIITAMPAVGFGIISYIVLSDSLRTSREAGAHETEAVHLERPVESDI